MHRKKSKQRYWNVATQQKKSWKLKTILCFLEHISPLTESTKKYSVHYRIGQPSICPRFFNPPNSYLQTNVIFCDPYRH